MKTAAERRESAWISIRVLCDLLDVSVEYGRRELQRRIPESDKRKVGRQWQFYAPAALRVLLRPELRRELIEEAEQAERRRAAADDDDDALLLTNYL